jgi:hypothetical protein
MALAMARDASTSGGPSSREAAVGAESAADDVTAVLVLIDSLSPAWSTWRLVRGASSLRRQPGLRLAKVLGSGRDGGFGVVPSATHGGLFCVFDTPADAAAFISESAVMADHRAHARELCWLVLRPYSSRGAWSGVKLAPSANRAGPGPIAALTRGSVRLSQAPAFWRHAPHTQRALDAAQGCRLAVGLGEAPLLRQATFSLWDDEAAMNAYAQRGAHLDAIRAAKGSDHFTESMFVRFAPLAIEGHWKGQRLG